MTDHQPTVEILGQFIHLEALPVAGCRLFPSIRFFLTPSQVHHRGHLIDLDIFLERHRNVPKNPRSRPSRSPSLSRGTDDASSFLSRWKYARVTFAMAGADPMRSPGTDEATCVEADSLTG